MQSSLCIILYYKLWGTVNAPTVAALVSVCFAVVMFALLAHVLYLQCECLVDALNTAAQREHERMNKQHVNSSYCGA
eukprot:4311-Heterococcus_DN1.PRE.2